MEQTQPIGNWDDLRYVLAVAETGSFIMASEKLKIDKTTVGRRIRRLEQSLGLKIFDRYAHGMMLTPSGKELHKKILDIHEKMQSIGQDLFSADSKLSGNVTIATTGAIATHWLIPNLFSFQEQYPQITIDLLVKYSSVNLRAREADITISMIDPTDEGTVSFKLGALSFSLYASHSYVERHGMPSSPADMGNHSFVELTSIPKTWINRPWNKILKDATKPVFSVNTSSAYLEAVKRGMGIGIFGDFKDSEIRHLAKLNFAPVAVRDVWLLSHEETNKTARIRALLDHLKDCLPPLLKT